MILRIKNNRALCYSLSAMMGGLVVTNLVPIVVILAECNPPMKYWKPSISGRCWPTKIRIYSIYFQVGMSLALCSYDPITNVIKAYSVVTDLICALLPIAVLWNVKITLKTKIGVCGLMSMGLIATAVAIKRATSLGTKTADLSYDVGSFKI